MWAESLASREITRNGDGITGSMSWEVPWAELEPVYDPYLRGFPQVGDGWPEWPTMRIVSLTARQGAHTNQGTTATLTAQYSTNQDLKEDPEEWVEEELRGRLESGQRLFGWTWRAAGTKVTQEISMPSFSGELQLTMRQITDRSAALMSCIGCVNDRIFRGVAAGRLQLQDVSQNTKYDPFTLAFVECKVSFSFGIRVHAWNEEWREPLSARSSDGRERFYQDADAAKPDYTTDATLVGTPVYVTGPAGTGEWDTPEGPDEEPKYSAIDMATLLGIPIKTGDTAPGTP